MAETQLFTWDSLATIGSASLLCFLIVSYTKNLIDKFFSWIPTDIYALGVSFSILVISQLATKPETMTDWRIYALSFFNAFLVASASAHINNKALSPPDLKAKYKKSKIKEPPETEPPFGNPNYSGDELKM